MEYGDQIILKNFWRRFFAYVIDSILLIVVFIAAVLLFKGRIAYNGWLFGMTATAMVLFYEALCVKIFGATLGKRAFKLQVLDLGLNPLGWWRSFFRPLSRFCHMFLFGMMAQMMFGGLMSANLKYAQDPLQMASHGSVKVMASLFLFWILSLIVNDMGYYSYFFTKNKQTLHDLMSGTLVVRKSRSGPNG